MENVHESSTAHARSVLVTKGHRGHSVIKIKMMKCLLLMVVLLMVGTVCLVEGKSGLQIGVKKRPETCDMKSTKGDRLSMHYTVRL